MPKFIIDEDAMNLVLAQLPGQPIFAEPDGSFLAPGVVDLVDDNSSAIPWQPFSDLARRMILGVEACKDIAFQAERFQKKSRQGRILKDLTVPVCSLMDVLGFLMADFNKIEWREARNQWLDHDQKLYQFVAKRLKKQHMQGAVRIVRNTLAAHLDLGAAHGGVRVPADEILWAMGDSLIMLMAMLKHPDAFSWVRSVAILENGAGRIVDTMFQYPLCFRWRTDMEGHVKEVGNIRLAADPLHEVERPVREAIAAYNMMVTELQSSLSTISLMPTEDLRKNPALVRTLSIMPK